MNIFVFEILDQNFIILCKMEQYTLNINNSFLRAKMASDDYLAKRQTFYTDPTQFPDSMPGITNHMGYMPITAEEAFGGTSCIDIPFEQFNINTVDYRFHPFIVKRSEWNDKENLVNFMRKFVICQEGVVQLPNPGDAIPKSSMYYSKIQFITSLAQIVVLSLELCAIKYAGEDFYEINGQFLKGYDSFYFLIMNGLHKYIMSRGTEFNKISPRDIAMSDEYSDDYADDIADDYANGILYDTGNIGFVQRIRRPPPLQHFTGLEPDDSYWDTSRLTAKHSLAISEPELEYSQSTSSNLSMPKLRRSTNDEVTVVENPEIIARFKADIDSMFNILPAKDKIDEYLVNP